MPQRKCGFSTAQNLLKRHGFQKICCQIYLYFANWHPEEPDKCALFFSIEISAFRRLKMSINVGDEPNIPPDEEACREEVASQEEIYLETTEEELRADLTSEPATAKHWRMNREKLESDWEREISDDECK
jgi:hypothetical protein